MKKIIFLLLPILLISACKKRTSHNEQVMTIYVENGKILKSIKYSELFSEVKFLPLETKDGCLIGKLDKIEFVDDEIVTLDARKAKAIHHFTADGKFVNKISQIGGGPGDYFQPDDISVNPETHEIAILDRTNLLIYDINNTYLKRIKMPVYAYKLAWYDHRFALYSRGEDALVLLDETGKRTSKFFKTNYVKKLVLNRPFQRFDSAQVLYFSHLDYTIYSISKNRVSPHIKFVFEEPMFTNKDEKSLERDENNVENFVQLKYYNENTSHIYLIYLYKRIPYMLLYDKLNAKQTIVDMRGIKNDITYGYEPPVPMGVDNNGYFVAKFDFSDVSDTNALKEVMGSASDGLDEMSNPILLFFKFK